MSILHSRLNEKQDFIDEVIENLDIDVNPFLQIPSKYALLGGGKRLRPLICMLSAEIAGGDYTSSKDAFLALELLHNGTLVHDDMIDDDALRRGRPSVHVRFGEKRAVLAGDTLLSLGLSYAAKTGNIHIVKRLSETAVKMVQGVALQTYYRRKTVSEAAYLDMVYLKSGSLFEAAAAIGCLSACADGEALSHLSDFGRDFGIAYQIRDDVSDALDGMGGGTRSDLLNGDLTIPFIYAIESDLISDADKRKLLDVFEGRSKHIDGNEIRRVYAETEAFERSLNMMKEYANRSRKSLDYFEGSDAKGCLCYLLDQYYEDLDLREKLAP